MAIGAAWVLRDDQEKLDVNDREGFCSADLKLLDAEFRQYPDRNPFVLLKQIQQTAGAEFSRRVAFAFNQCIDEGPVHCWSPLDILVVAQPRQQSGQA